MCETNQEILDVVLTSFLPITMNREQRANTPIGGSVHARDVPSQVESLWSFLQFITQKNLKNVTFLEYLRLHFKVT